MQSQPRTSRRYGRKSRLLDTIRRARTTSNRKNTKSTLHTNAPSFRRHGVARFFAAKHSRVLGPGKWSFSVARLGGSNLREGTSQGGTRLRNTARVVLITPMQRPSYIPGSELLKNQTPSSVFRCELYNMIPVPPWGRLCAFSEKDQQILRPVADRLSANGHTAVPAGFYHSSDILDVRIITQGQADRLLAARSWRPRTDWVVRRNKTAQEGDAFSLICCWQDDSADITNDREYLSYILEMLRARARLGRNSTEVSCREYSLT